MKKFVRFVCAALVSALLLTSCGQSQSQSGTATSSQASSSPAASVQSSGNSKLDPQKTTYGGDNADTAITENGVYYTDMYAAPYPLLMFYDFESGKAVPLCSNPQCRHDDPDTCSAVFKYGVSGLFYNSEKECLQAAEITNSKVYAIKTNGSGRDSIGDMGLVSAGSTSVHFTGTFMISNDTMSFTSFTKDGSAALYVLPLYKNAKPQKIYEAASSTLNDYPLIVYIYTDAMCGDIAIFHEVSVVSAPVDVSAEDIGRPRYLATLKYISPDMDEPVTVAENYNDITTYGEQYLISGDAGFAVWDPSTNEVESIELPQQVMDAYEQVGAVYSIDYDATDGTYYVVIPNADTSENSNIVRTIFVLNSDLQLKNTIYVNDFAYDYLGQTADSVVAVGSAHGENSICILPKSELETQSEINWKLKNVLE